MDFRRDGKYSKFRSIVSDNRKMWEEQLGRCPHLIDRHVQFTLSHLYAKGGHRELLILPDAHMFAMYEMEGLLPRDRRVF